MNSVVKFEHLPNEILYTIIANLPIEDQIKCHKMSRRLRLCCDFQIYNTKNNHLGEFWKSKRVCDILLEKLLPKEMTEKKMKILIRDKKLYISGRTGLVCLSNILLAFKTYSWSKMIFQAFLGKTISEKLSLMQGENEDIRSGKRDINTEHFGTIRQKEWENVEQYENSQKNIHLITKFSSIALTVIIQLGNFYFHYQDTKEINEKNHDDEVNQTIYKELSYPEELLKDTVLINYRCRISGKIPLIPVVDKCGHFFDYVFISDHIKKTVQCPIRKQRLIASDLIFDSHSFFTIQNRIKFLKESEAPILKNLTIHFFNLKKGN